MNDTESKDPIQYFEIAILLLFMIPSEDSHISKDSVDIEKLPIAVIEYYQLFTENEEEDRYEDLLYDCVLFCKKSVESLKSKNLVSYIKDPYAGTHIFFQKESIHAFISNNKHDYSSVIGKFYNMGLNWQRKALRRILDLYPQPLSLTAIMPDLAPASDRIISFDDNNPIVRNAFEGLDQVIKDFRADNNEVGIDPDEKAALLNDLELGKSLRNKPHLFLETAQRVIIKPLKYIADKFVGSALGELGKKIVQLFLSLPGQ